MTKSLLLFSLSLSVSFLAHATPPDANSNLGQQLQRLESPEWKATMDELKDCKEKEGDPRPMSSISQAVKVGMVRSKGRISAEEMLVRVLNETAQNTDEKNINPCTPLFENYIFKNNREFKYFEQELYAYPRGEIMMQVPLSRLLKELELDKYPKKY